MSYYLYIIRSEVKETCYIGISNDPGRRVFFHNNSDTQKHTLRFRPWELVYTHEFTPKEEALADEAKVKSWKNKKMARLVVEGEIEIIVNL